MHWLWASLISLVGLAGPIFAVLGLPGAWLLIGLMLLGQIPEPALFNWWTIGVCAALAVLGEILETGASAVAVKAGKGSKRGMWGAIIGGLVGALAGAPFGLFIGALAGGLIGAGVGAALAEAGGGMATRDAMKAGGAAAAGRFAGVVSKALIACLIYLIVVVAAFWP
jgi:uncharacterized protein